MKKLIDFLVVLMIIILMGNCSTKSNSRRISVEEYRTKMKAGWLGQKSYQLFPTISSPFKLVVSTSLM